MTSIDLFKPPQEIRELNLLQELERNPIVSQRELSHKFGIALGVTNACLKRMARRGWIRMMNQDHRKIGYFLTPKGFAEKAKLTLHLISWTVKHYSTLKEIIGKKLLEVQNNGFKTIVFYGVSDEMEIAYVTLQGLNLKLVGIVEDEERLSQENVFGFEVKKLDEVMSLEPDVIFITTPTGIEEKSKRLTKYLETSKARIIFLCDREDLNNT
jgi:DNA-binding MarR family transcriptional regulator